MKFNFDALAVDLDGTPLKDPNGNEVPLGKALANQIAAKHEEGMTFDDKEKIYRTAKKLNTGGDITLSPEELVLIKEVAAKTLLCSVCGQIADVINE